MSLSTNQSLKPQIREVVNAFKDTYIILMNDFRITMTDKVHIICDHLPDYLEEREKTLLKTTDQTILGFYEWQPHFCTASNV